MVPAHNEIGSPRHEAGLQHMSGGIINSYDLPALDLLLGSQPLLRIFLDVARIYEGQLALAGLLTVLLIGASCRPTLKQRSR